MELTLGDISKRLTLDIIDKCFKVKTNSKDTVKSVAVTSGSPAGEGLISAVYRLHVTGSTHKTTFIAKGLVKDLLLRRTLRCHKLFERETVFFADILPQLEDVQRALGAKESIQKHIPICYSYHIGDDEDYLILEDLSESACESVKNPTIEHRNMVMQVLAHLHAASMALRHHKPYVFAKLAKNISEDLYFNDDNREWYDKYLRNAIEIVKEVLREFEPETSVYYKKFQEIISNDPYGQAQSLVHYTDAHPTINHGDAWLPNFMYSKERTVTIDFQLCRCVSPVVDITYFLGLCSNLCPTKEDFYDVLNIYHSFLEYYLSDMRLDAKKVYSREEFEKELKKYGKFGLLAGLTSIPLMASTDKCDVKSSFQDRFGDVERIPLYQLWPLEPVTDPVSKMKLVTNIRLAVDLGFI